MFEIEKMEQEFDYSLVDSETADFLRSCEYEMNGIAEDARLKVGRVLERAQKKLASHDNNKGVFQKWIISGGLSLDNAYYFINLNRSSRNLDNRQKDNFLSAPKTLQKEVMKKNAPEELKQKVYDGDITTNKEYQEMKKKLEELEQTKQQVEQQLKEEQSKEPKIIEKEIIKEVDNTDYNQINSLRDQLLRKEKHYSELENELKQLKQDTQKYQQLEENLQQLYRDKEEVEEQIKAATSISKLVVDVENFVKEKVGGVKYTKAVQERIDSYVVQENLESIGNLLIKAGQDVLDLLPQFQKNKDIIEMDIIEGMDK